MTTMRAARATYYEANGFGADGGASSAWVDFKLGPIPMPFPNSDARREALRYHDLHHVVTGYATDTIGEFEISAWELGAGCRRFIAAWVLNLGGLLAGLIAAPKKTVRAFLRGRASQSLYALPLEALLDRSVDEVRSELCDTGPSSHGSLSSFAWLAGAVILGLLVWLPGLVLAPFVVLPYAFLVWSLRRRRRVLLK